MSEMKIIAPAVHGWRGEPVIPGDKSISHRSVMLAGLGSTPVHIKNFLHAADCLSTVGVMRALGVRVEFPAASMDSPNLRPYLMPGTRERRCG